MTGGGAGEGELGAELSSEVSVEGGDARDAVAEGVAGEGAAGESAAAEGAAAEGVVVGLPVTGGDVAASGRNSL